jgi:hypothetical protein
MNAALCSLTVPLEASADRSRADRVWDIAGAVIAHYTEELLQALRVPNLKVEEVFSPTRFDGIWNVTVHCPAYGGASGYTLRFPAQVKDAVLAGQFGTPGQPGSLALAGRIEPDGNASIDARGMTGDAKYAANQVGKGANYSYRVEARFDGTRGGGDRTETRPCSLSFLK